MGASFKSMLTKKYAAGAGFLSVVGLFASEAIATCWICVNAGSTTASETQCVPNFGYGRTSCSVTQSPEGYYYCVMGAACS